MNNPQMHSFFSLSLCFGLLSGVDLPKDDDKSNLVQESLGWKLTMGQGRKSIANEDVTRLHFVRDIELSYFNVPTWEHICKELFIKEQRRWRVSLLQLNVVYSKVYTILRACGLVPASTNNSIVPRGIPGAKNNEPMTEMMANLHEAHYASAQHMLESINLRYAGELSSSTITENAKSIDLLWFFHSRFGTWLLPPLVYSMHARLQPTHSMAMRRDDKRAFGDARFTQIFKEWYLLHEYLHTMANIFWANVVAKIPICEVLVLQNAI